MMMAYSVHTAFLASLLLVDCQRVTPSPFPPMDLNQPFKTYCVGRMLIDLPEEIRQYPDSSPGGYVRFFYGLDGSFRTVDMIVFEQRQPKVELTLLREKSKQAVREHQDELRAKLNEETKAPMLVSSRPIGENGVLTRRYKSAQSGGVFVSEPHLLAGGIRHAAFEAAICPIGGTYGEDGETAEIVESRLKNFVANTHAYINVESAGLGFCVDSVVPNDKHDNKCGKFELDSSFHKGMGFDICIEVLTEQDEGLHA